MQRWQRGGPGGIEGLFAQGELMALMAANVQADSTQCTLQMELLLLSVLVLSCSRQHQDWLIIPGRHIKVPP